MARIAKWVSYLPCLVIYETMHRISISMVHRSLIHIMYTFYTHLYVHLFIISLGPCVSILHEDYDGTIGLEGMNSNELTQRV